MLDNFSLVSVSSGWGATNTGTARGPEKLLNSLDPFFMLSSLQNSPQTFADIFQHKIHVEPKHQPSEDLYPLTTQYLKNRQNEIIPVCEQLYNVCTKELQNDQKIFVFGGDQSISIGTWSAVADYSKNPIGLIWIDAHLDAHTFDTSPSQASHGMAAAVLLGYGETALTHLGQKIPKLLPDRLVYMGARSYEEGEHKLLQKLGVKIYYMDEIKARGFDAVFQEARQHVSRGDCPYGITFDIDAIDPHEAPGTGAPAENGIHGAEVLKTFQGLFVDEKLMAFECVEFNPQLDKNEMTLTFIWKLFHAMNTKT